LTNSAVDLREAIDREANILTSVADLASLTIDTTKNFQQGIERTNRHPRARKRRCLSQPTVSLLRLQTRHSLWTQISSLICAVLPNPHWQPALRPLSGLHQEVAGYLAKKSVVNEMFDDITGYLERWIPRFADNDRVYLTIGIGCTGGQHRSVYMAERLATHFSEQLDQGAGPSPRVGKAVDAVSHVQLIRHRYATRQITHR
jgi:UPF0042 nucleotide-binding protein